MSAVMKGSVGVAAKVEHSGKTMAEKMAVAKAHAMVALSAVWSVAWLDDQ